MVSSVKSEDSDGSMRQIVGLPSNSYKPNTNTAWVRTRLCKLQKVCTRIAAASDKIYQLLANGRWFSLSTPTSPTTKIGRHDIAEILLKVASNNNHSLTHTITEKCHVQYSQFIIQSRLFLLFYLYNPDPITETTNYPGYRRNKYPFVSSRFDTTGSGIEPTFYPDCSEHVDHYNAEAI